MGVGVSHAKATRVVVAVGTTITCIRLLRWVDGVEAFVRIGMQDMRLGNPSGQEWGKSPPVTTSSENILSDARS